MTNQKCQKPVPSSHEKEILEALPWLALKIQVGSKLGL
jgi:hypothetical protein